MLIRQKRQAGYATVFGIIIITSLAVISAAIWFLVNSETRMAHLNRDALEAEYAAEAGAKRAVIEFLKVNSNISPEFGWLDKDIAFVNDVTSKSYRVIVYLDTDSTKTNTTPVFTADHTYIVQSTGRIISPITGITVKKIVSVSVKVTKGGGNEYISGTVFSYSVYSQGNLDAYGGAGAIIYGDVGTTGSIVKITGLRRFISGIVSTSTIPDFYFNTPPAAGWYVIRPANEIGSLTVTIPDVPTIPSAASSNPRLPITSGNQLWNATRNLSQSNYYYGDSYSLSSANLIAPSGQPVTIYVNGDLNLWDSSITGDDVTIYVAGDLVFSGDSAISVSNSTGKSRLNLYVQKAVRLSNNAVLNGDAITVKAGNLVSLSNTCYINRNYASALTTIYSKESISLSNDVIIGGYGLMAANDYVSFTVSVSATNTIFINGKAGSRDSYVGGKSTTLAGFYTNGALGISESPTIANPSAVVQKFGLGDGSSKVEVVSGSWNSH